MYESQLEQPEQPFRLSAIESVLSSEIGECSIVAAEVNRKSHEMMNNSDAVDATQLYLFDGNVEQPDFRTYNTVRLTDEVILDDGRPIEYRLVQRAKTNREDEPPILLCGIVRGTMAFPMASFTRRNNSYCDYVQIGNEMNDESLVVTPEDEVRSRKEVIDLINNALDVDPLAIRYIEAFKIDGTKVPSLIRAISKRQDNVRMIKPTMFRDDCIKGAILDLAADKEYYSNARFSTRVTEWYGADHLRPRMNIAEMKSRLAKLSKVSLKKIAAGKFPGCDNEVCRAIVLREALAQRGITEAEVGTAKTNLNRTANAVDVKSAIDARFGVYDARTEKILSFSGKLAASRQAKTSMVVEDMRMASDSRADTEVTFEAQKSSIAGDYMLRLFVKPVALTDTEPVKAGEYLVTTFRPNDLDKKDKAELSYLIDMAEKKVGTH